MKTKTFVKNETWKNEGTLVHKEGKSNEHEVGERADDEDLKVPALGCAAEDQHRDVKQRKRNDVFAGNHAPVLCIEWLAKGAIRRERQKTKHGQTESGKKRDPIAEGHRPQGDEEDQDGEPDAVSVIRKEVGRPEQENGHRGHIKEGRKSQSQMQGTKQKTGNAPERVVIPVTGQSQGWAGRG